MTTRTRTQRASNVVSTMVATAAVVMLALIGAGSADATTVGLTPAFSAADLGEGATLTAKLTIAGTEYHGSPAPLSDIALHLPAGTGLATEAFATCTRQTLAVSGPSACPPGSQAGPVGEVSYEEAKEGGGHTPGTGTVQAFFAPPQSLEENEGEEPPEGPQFFLYFSIRGGLIQFVGSAQLSKDAAPYGPLLSLEWPFIETIPHAPLVSWTGITLMLGTSYEEEGVLVHSVSIPEECPLSGKFPWAADLTLKENTFETEGPVIHQHAAAETTCPQASSKRGTTTAVAASSTSLTVGQTITYTATVTPKTPGAPEPTGKIRFLDGTTAIAGCEAKTLTQGSSFSTATCTLSYPAVGPHQISAKYAGDGNFFGSVSGVQAITVSAVAKEPSNKQHEEEVASRMRAEAEAAAAHKREAEAAANKTAEEERAANVKIDKIKVSTGRILVTVRLSHAGTVTITGPGLKKTAVSLAAGTHQVAVALTAAGRTEHKHRKTIKLAVSLKMSANTVASSEKVKL